MWAWLAWVVGCGGPVQDVAPDEPARSAIVLVVDGVRTDEICGTTPSSLTGVPGDAMAPELWATLAERGSYSRAALNTGVTITAPAHTALLTGRNEAYANFSLDDEGAGLYRPAIPTIFEAARARLGLGKDDVVLLSNTVLLEGLTHSVDPGPGAGEGARWAFVAEPGDVRPGDDAGVFEELRRLVEEGPPRLVVANLHDVDRAGHYSADPAYPARIAEVDERIADFWRWVNAEHPAYAENLLLVVTADHGRHREGREDAWREHGDACDGCREVPLFVVGGGAPAGHEYATPPLTIDLAPTLAAHLGMRMPWAEGLPLDGFDGLVRSGEVAVSASGALVATQAWRDDPLARSEVLVDGALVSTPGVLGAEAPSVLDGTIADLACWRELGDTGDARPWVPRCLADTGAGWVDVGFPSELVSPFWEPALAERDGRLWAAWAENPNGAAEHREGVVGMALASWAPDEGWSTVLQIDGYFPTDPAIVATDRALVAAFGTSLEDPVSRYTRRVRVVPYTLASGAPEPAGFTDFARDGARIELPALAAEGATVRLAMVVIDGNGPQIEAVTSEDGGRTWSAPVVLPGVPSVHLAPAWDGEALVWAEEDRGVASLCRAAPGDDAATCVAVESSRVHSFAVRDGVTTVVRDADVGVWELHELTW